MRYDGIVVPISEPENTSGVMSPDTAAPTDAHPAECAWPRRARQSSVEKRTHGRQSLSLGDGLEWGRPRAASGFSSLLRRTKRDR